MDKRKVFDTIPEQFDRWRPRYCQPAFDAIIEAAHLGAGASALEIGPGTGQATEPILKSGCDYLAIELGEHLAAFATERFRGYDNFHLVCDDFVTHDFGAQRFDLVLSAATIQWIPEEVAFPKVFSLLKSGGVLAMMMTRGDYKTLNPALHAEISQVYERYFHPDIPYTCRMNYANVVNYGFQNFRELAFDTARTLSTEEYLSFIGTHCDHITLSEPYRTPFFEGVRAAVDRAGGHVTTIEKVVLYLAEKP